MPPVICTTRTRRTGSDSTTQSRMSSSQTLRYSLCMKKANLTVVLTPLCREATHSDVLIYKHGGWYSDLDVVFMKDIRGLSNIITGDHHPRAEDYASIGGALNNAIFHFDRKHPFVQACLEDFASNFNPEVRLSGGPNTFTNALMKVCQVPLNTQIDTHIFTPERCQGVNVVQQRILYPIGWVAATELYSIAKSRAAWAEQFQHSVSVHMFNSMKQSHRKVLRAKFYGSEVPAYLYLGEKFCPISYDSVKVF